MIWKAEPVANNIPTSYSKTINLLSEFLFGIFFFNLGGAQSGWGSLINVTGQTMKVCSSFIVILLIVATTTSYPTGFKRYPFLPLINTRGSSTGPELNGVRNIECPDKKTCSDTSTCCKTASGAYGCCSIPHAVCCSDGKHCCPAGYECADKDGSCSSSPSTVSTFHSISAADELHLVDNAVICPNGSGSCKSDQTCCKLASGKDGCCPLPNAVCCSDGEHCCPNDYACQNGECVDETKPTLSAKEHSIKKSSTPLTPVTLRNTICPDRVTECPTGNYTCCMMSSEKYGCCPFLNAVCCTRETGKCCPEGYECNEPEGTCSQTYSASVHPLVTID